MPPPLPPPPTSPGGTGIRKKSKKSASNIPHHKAGRVKVGIRCRPPFQEEIDKVKGGSFSPVILARPDIDPTALGKIILNLPTGKQREFMFDYVFGPVTAQDVVYDRVARPVVNDVLNGFNGTIFALVPPTLSD
jgi:kinesin family member 11